MTSLSVRAVLRCGKTIAVYFRIEARNMAYRITLVLAVLAGFVIEGLAQHKLIDCFYYDTATDSKFDLSPLKGKMYYTQDGNGYNYAFSPCAKIGGTDQCLKDPDGVVTGMAIQRKDAENKCFVLGQYDDEVTAANWGVLKDTSGKVDGVQLAVENGDPLDCPGPALPRSLIVQFTCGVGEAPADNTWKVTEPSPCHYSLKFPTKYACTHGELPAPIIPKVKPSSFGSTFLIIIGIFLGVYIIGGMAYNAFSKRATGAELFPKGIGEFLFLALQGSIYFFTRVKELVAPSRVGKGYDDRIDYAAAVDTSSKSYQNQYDSIGTGSA